MMQEFWIALVVNLGAVAVALINRGGWKRVEVKLDALAKHLGVRLDDGGRVIVLERKAPSVVPAAERRE